MYRKRRAGQTRGGMRHVRGGVFAGHAVPAQVAPWGEIRRQPPRTDPRPRKNPVSVGVKYISPPDLHPLYQEVTNSPRGLGCRSPRRSSAVGALGGRFAGVGLPGGDDGAFRSRMQAEAGFRGGVANGIVKSVRRRPGPRGSRAARRRPLPRGCRGRPAVRWRGRRSRRSASTSSSPPSCSTAGPPGCCACPVPRSRLPSGLETVLALPERLSVA